MTHDPQTTSRGSAAFITEEALIASPPLASFDISGVERFGLAEQDLAQLNRVFHATSDGRGNIEAVYPLTPLQEGILFYHLLGTKRDSYVLSTLLEVNTRSRLNDLISSVQATVDRHDVLRVSIHWENLSRPLQVVHRRASLKIEELPQSCDIDAAGGLNRYLRTNRHAWNLRQAPLVRLLVFSDTSGSPLYALLQLHHIICDYGTLRTVVSEIVAHLTGRHSTLSAPTAYGDHLAQVFSNSRHLEDERFFREKLATVDEPTSPFEVIPEHGEIGSYDETTQTLSTEVSGRLRYQARRLQVTPARLFHAAWSLVLAHTTGRDDVVFGTVVLANWQRNINKQRILGLSVNTLPLRLRLRDITVLELVYKTQEELMELLRHDQAPLTLTQRCSGVAASTPLFTSLFNFRHDKPQADWSWTGIPGIRLLERAEAWTNYPITVIVDDTGENFALFVQTDSRIKSARVVGYLSTAVLSLVDALEHSPHSQVLRLAILPEDEHRCVLQLFNETRTKYPINTLIHELFEEQVLETPLATAIYDEEQSLTYVDLDRRANQLAHHLVDLGVEPDQLVGVFVERGLEMIIALLGVLKSGGAYVSLDPNYPSDRLTYILNDSAPGVVLTQDRLLAKLPQTTSTVICLDKNWDVIAQRSQLAPSIDKVNLCSDHLAYIIYTSGSTGRPKGVAIEHKSTANLIRWARDAVDRRAFSRTLHSTSLNFDLSVYECFVPLSTGGSICVVENALELIQVPSKVSLINTVPSALAAILDATRIPDETQVINLAGEVLKRELVERIFLLSQAQKVCNLYGPSETTTYSTWIPMTREEGFSTSIGRPIANTQIYILDANRLIVPIGVVGEIYIGGVGVARGYLNRPELTAERFIADPFSSDLQARMYRTGDLGRWRSDGVIEYVGRNDHQVKIRGFRIELGEIESCLTHHAQIKEAAVVAREDVPGEKRLIAYVVYRNSERGSSVSDIDSLRSHLRASLPEYMVPSTFVTLQRLPLTPNGKLNRQALPTPDLTAFSLRTYDPPQGEIEEILSGIWRVLLGVERVGRDDNFFELGGNSLLIVRLLERIRRFGLITDVRAVFETPRLADLAVKLIRLTNDLVEVPPYLIPLGCEKLTPTMLSLVTLDAHQIERLAGNIPGSHRNIEDIYPLTPLQDGILFHHLLNEREDVYVIPTLMLAASRQRAQDLIAGLQRTVDRYAALRTAIFWDQLPQPVQVVCRSAKLPVEEAALDKCVPITDQLRTWTDPRSQRIDLTQAPLLRVRVAADPHSSQVYILLQIHHIVCDNTALDSILSEIAEFLEGSKTELASPAPYRNHVAAVLFNGTTAEAAALFQSKLGDVDETTAPFDLKNIHGGADRIVSAQKRLSANLSKRIRGVGRKTGVSPATLFHSAWALVTALTTNRNDVTFGTVLLGRTRATAEAKRSVGLYINTLPFRARLLNLSALDLLYQTQRELVDLLSHEHTSLPFAQSFSGLPASVPLFTSILNYRHRDVALEEKFSGSLGIRLLESRAWTNYPLLISVDDLGNEFLLTADTDRTVEPQRIAEYLQTSLESLVSALENDPNAPALSLEVLPEIELGLVLMDFNRTKRLTPYEGFIHDLFEEQVRRTPDTLAVLHDGIYVTYAELDRKADAIAEVLRWHGLRPDDLVALCMGRHIETIAAILGILKAGGAYLPLDQSYPADRLNMMLEDAKPRLLIADGGMPSSLKLGSTRLISLESLQIAPSNLSEVSSRRNNALGTLDTLLYVIYTSGSTGRPKGIAMSHCAMGNLIHWHRERFGDGHGTRVLQYAALSFDVAFQEIFSTLCTGATLVLVDDQIRRDADALLGHLNSALIERLFLPPVMLQGIAEISKGRTPSTLREVIAAGEQLQITQEVTEFCSRGIEISLHNHYGPTETHVVTEFTLTGSATTWPRLPPIGRPISNSQIYILNGSRKPTPIGVCGEIYIGGANLARGYLNRPQLTAERFVSSPFDGGSRLYKTGDLGRWKSDGTLEYLGRNDEQVKIRGFRIELGEIETLLTSHPSVDRAVVVTHEPNPGDRRLVAYIIGHRESIPSAEDLRVHLNAALPNHMIPAAFVILEEFPLTPSGKINRRALPSPDSDAYVDREYEAPHGYVEEAIAATWQRLLHVNRIGRTDNFFELGGHSLLATRVVSHLRETLQVEIAVAAIFASPTLAEFATCVMHKSVKKHDPNETLIDVLTQDFRDQIAKLDDLEVARRIAELENRLGSDSTSWQ